MKSLAVTLLAWWCLVAGARAEDACGGTYRGFQYTITSPNYPGNYPARTECTYRLQGEPTSKCEQQFHLQFLDFNLKASEGCKGDYLQVGDQHLYCGNTSGLRKFTATSNNTLIVTFHSDDRDTAKGFKILISALPCSLKLSPLRDSPSKLGIPEAGRSSWKARDIESTVYGRGISNSPTSSLNPLSSDLSPTILRDQIGSVSATENNSIVSNDVSPRVTSYLFLPPKDTSANVTLRYLLGPSSISDNLPTHLLPPRIGSTSTFSTQEALHVASSVKKIGGEQDYDLPAVQPGDCDKSSHQQLLQSNVASSERFNYDPAQTPGYGSSLANLVYDPRYGFVASGYYPPNAGRYPGGSQAAHPTANPGSGYYPTYPNVGYEPNYPSGSSLPAGFVGPGPECCRVPSSRRFSITSPGFPGGLPPNEQLSCRYTIVKSSPDVCRLRLSFRFFNFGADEPYCSLGYVDIDGQRFCGCRTGQSLQLLFTDYLVKSISIFSAGYPRGRLGGFLIDVTQEPCDTQQPYPASSYNPAYPGGYIRRRSANASDIVPSALDPNPLIRSKRDLGYSYPKPNRPFHLDRDAEWMRPSAVAAKAQTHDRFFAGNCHSRLPLDWVIASKEAFFKNARCTTAYGFGARFSRSYQSPDEDESTNCREINENQGEIKSPLYPNVYPANLSKCYRFNRAPNFCKLELYVRDFDLESSQGCASDYLSFSGVELKKYCGRSLQDFRTVFDLTQTSSLEVDFVTDDRGTGRGFDIGFSQLPCEPTPIL